MAVMTAGKPDVGAVVVTYHPDHDKLNDLLLALVPQVSRIVVVDNGSAAKTIGWIRDHAHAGAITLIALGDNAGLAFAQNAGIRELRQGGTKYVILFDQDSAPEPGMIENLLAVVHAKTASGTKIGAVAPVYKAADAQSFSGFVQLGWLDFRRVACSAGKEAVEAHFLISSGTLIPMAVLDDVGDMEDQLFIDHVDTEWCFRAQHRGYALFGVCGARMYHNLGNRRQRVWLFRWREVPHHSPFRYYYIFRNSLLLQRRSYMPFRWKLADAYRCMRAMAYFGLFSTARRENLRMMFKGLRHGISGISGKMPG